MEHINKKGKLKGLPFIWACYSNRVLSNQY